MISTLELLLIKRFNDEVEIIQTSSASLIKSPCLTLVVVGGAAAWVA